MIKVLKTKYSNQVEEEFYKQLQKSKLLLPDIIRYLLIRKKMSNFSVHTDWINFQ